jgi:hypothetical protein
MNWHNCITDADEKKVFEALDGPDITWRTTSAIARQTGLPESMVVAVLEKYNRRLATFAEEPSITGAALVGLREKVG